MNEFDKINASPDLTHTHGDKTPGRARRFSMILVLLIIAAALLGSEVKAEGTQASGKKAGESWLSDGMLSGIYAANYADDPRVVDHDYGWKIDGLYPPGFNYDKDLKEPVLSATLTQISGDEALQNAFILEGCESLCCNMDHLDVCGEAAYLLHLESEHYLCEIEFNVEFFDIRQIDVRLETDRVSVPLNQEVYFSNLLDQTAVSISPVVEDISFWAWTPDGEWNYDSEEYSLHVTRVTGKKSGDYPLLLLVGLGNNAAKMSFPMTLHVNTPDEDSAEAELAQLDEEARNAARGISIVRQTSGGEFSEADGIRQAECLGVEYDLKRKWVYMPSSLPDGIRENSTGCVVLLSTPGKGENICPTAYAVDFVSGNESLRNALVFEDMFREGTRTNLQLLIDNQQLKEPGEAVFRIRLQADTLYYETEYTLRVLDWAEYPAFEPLTQDMYLSVRHGITNASLYTVNELLGALIEDRVPQIATELGMDHYPCDYKSIKTDGDYTTKVLEGINAFVEPTYQFIVAGLYRFQILFHFGNAAYEPKVTIQALPYMVSGPYSLRPGDSGRYRIIKDNSVKDMQFMLEAEGEFIQFDPDTGLLTASENAPEGAAFTVTAVPETGEPAFSFFGTITRSLFGGARVQTTSWKGFRIPYFTGNGFVIDNPGSPYSIRTDGSTSQEAILYYDFQGLKEWIETPEDALRIYEDLTPWRFTKTDSEMIEIDGYPAMVIYGQSEDEEYISYHAEILYARGNRVLRGLLTHRAPIDAPWESLLPVSSEDVRFVAENIYYVPTQLGETQPDQ